MDAEMTVSDLMAVSGGSRQSGELFEPSSTCTKRKKFERAEYWKQKLLNSNNGLPRRPGCLSSESEGGSALRAKAGFDRAGKARCAKNALRHGGRSRAHIQELQRIRYVLRLAEENVRKVRALIRLRDARPQIRYKPNYAHRLALGANRALVRCSAKQESGGEPCVHWLL